MVSLSALSSITDKRKVCLRAELRQGQPHDFFGTATILGAQDPPLVRIALSGRSGQDRPSAWAMDPEKDFYIRLGIGSRAVNIRMHMHKVESDDQTLFKPVEIEQEDQNRTFFRVQASFEVKIITRHGPAPESSFQTGEVKDISGSGLLIHTAKDYKPGTVLNLEFSLEAHDQMRRVSCSATVVRCLTMEHKGYETAVEFRDLTEDQRDTIMAYCFAQQREQLRENVQVRDLE